MSSGGVNCLIGNYCFPPLSGQIIFCDQIKFLESNVDFTSIHAHIYCDFNLVEFDWETGVSSVNNISTKLKLNPLTDFTHYDGFQQHNTMQTCCGNVLDLALVTSAISICLAGETLSRIDDYHAPFVISFHFPVKKANFYERSWYCYLKGD